MFEEKSGMKHQRGCKKTKKKVRGQRERGGLLDGMVDVGIIWRKEGEQGLFWNEQEKRKTRKRRGAPGRRRRVN